MIEMLRIYSKAFLENVTIEEFTPWPFFGLQRDKHRTFGYSTKYMKSKGEQEWLRWQLS
jgi:hypothetical protein